MVMTVNSDLTIYNSEAQTAYLERQQDVLDVFNAASRGAIVLRNEAIVGDFDKSTYYKNTGTIGDRDVNSTADATLAGIGQGERVGVKYAWKYSPIAVTEESFKRRARNLSEFSQLMGSELADAELAHNIGVAVGSLSAAVSNNSAMSIGTADLASNGVKVLTKGLRAFGDRAERVVIWCMSSGVYYDLVDKAIDDKVFNEDFAVIHGAQPGTLGRPVLVSDKFADDTIYGLQAGAITLTESQAPGVRLWQINDKENLALGFRAEGVVNIDLMGYSYKGSANPTMANLKAKSNWIKYAADDKSTAGVVIDTTAAAGGSGSGS